MHIGVLGAGIIGLNTALEIQKEFPNAKVTLVADKFNEDTLSYGAAGIFRPGTNFRGPTDEITRQWIVDAYDVYDRIYRSDNAMRAGVMQVSGYIYSSKFSSITKNHFLEQLLPVYRPATEDELTLCPGNWKYGAFFQTMVIESADFLPWALNIFKLGSGQVYKKRVNNFEDLEGFKFDYLINCSGFGSKLLCDDQRLVPIRGQVFKVKAPWIKMFYYGDYDTYVIPGKNIVTLGGCRQFDSYNEEIDPHDSAGIWSRCTSLVPSLKKSVVVKEWVGLRPYRDQVRCEFDKDQSSNKMKIIHSTGYGGYGVTASPGAAIYVTKLIKENLRGKETVPNGITEKSKL